MQLFAPMFVLGVWVLQQLPALPDGYWLAVLTLPIFFAVVLHRSARSPILNFPALKTVNRLLLAFSFGFLWASGYAHVRLADELPRQWEGHDIQLIGVVASLPQWLERGERFEFDVERVLTPQAEVPQHLSLSQYRAGSFQKNVAAKASADCTFHAGQRWQLTVRLKRPHGTANPHGFDFEAWALQRNIRANGSVQHVASNRLLTASVYRPAYLLEVAREQIRARMRRVLGDHPSSAVLQALVIGDDNSISAADWQVFLRTGINHLMSISGLHITMLAGIAFSLVFAFWRRVEYLTLRLPARKAAVVAGLLVAIVYSLLAGFSVPTQRTLYMLAVFAVALWSGRQVVMSQVLAFALVLVVLLDPWAVLAPGFWLSFGAVAVIAYTAGGRLNRSHWLREAVQTQWAVTLGLLPILLLLFQQVSIISPLANAFAIPLVSLVVVPLALIGSLLPVDSALQLSAAIMHAAMLPLDRLAAWPLATWQQQAPQGWALPLALFGVLWLLLPRGFPLRWLGLAALLPMLLPEPAHTPVGAMRVAVLDVGQGLSVVVRTASHVLLFDTGPRYSAQSDSGSRIVLPYLRGEGIRHLDGLMLSHNDSDHSGGMASVLAQVPVDWLVSSLPESAQSLATYAYIHCYAGQRWVWDEVDFEVLQPTLQSYNDNSLSDNNRSCVLRVASRFGSLLLTGDIEREVESKLVESHPERLAADVLVVPHHGSKTSSTPDFIRAVAPKMAIFTVGYRNRFGHPKAQVLARYAQMGSEIYRSDADGAILLDFVKPQQISVTRWRSQSRRYWQDVSELAESPVTR